MCSVAGSGPAWIGRIANLTNTNSDTATATQLDHWLPVKLKKRFSTRRKSVMIRPVRCSPVVRCRTRT